MMAYNEQDKTGEIKTVQTFFSFVMSDGHPQWSSVYRTLNWTQGVKLV
jgi:hypothetical protein